MGQAGGAPRSSTANDRRWSVRTSQRRGGPRSRATASGLATAAATARLVAGGEDGGQVRRPERPRLPPTSMPADRR